MENLSQLLENHHGVFVNISGHGVLIIGKAGIGKSSFALELISQGHQLIADDIVDFVAASNKVVFGSCPPLLKGLLHTRELGLTSISTIFGKDSWRESYPLHYVVELTTQSENTVSLSTPQKNYTVQGQSFPLITLSTNNPATLYTRLSCWLSMQSQQHQPEHAFKKAHQMIKTA